MPWLLAPRSGVGVGATSKEVRGMDKLVVTPAQWAQLSAMLDRPARRLPRLERLMRETPPWRDDESRDETS